MIVGCYEEAGLLKLKTAFKNRLFESERMRECVLDKIEIEKKDSLFQLR
jgi:hypothetical protein